MTEVVTRFSPTGAIHRFDDWLGRPVSMRALALLRVLVGPVVLLHLRPFLADARHGVIYRDRFYELYAAWYPELPRGWYVALLWIGVGAAIAMSIGLASRLATVTTFAVVTYNLILSTTHYHNNRAYLVVVLAALAVVPSGRVLSVDAWWRARTRRAPLDSTSPAWPLWLLRFEAATVYGASGLSKLLDRDWFGGTVTWHRVSLVRHRLDASPLPAWAVTALTERSFHTVAAKVIVATELFIAIGLFWPVVRLAAVWVAVCFHVTIHVSASVQVFSYLAVAALVIWAVPSTRDRLILIDITDSRQRRFAGGVRALDWLARFRIAEGPPGSALQVTDRDGAVYIGRPAIVLALSRLPSTAWFALPTLLMPTVRPSQEPSSERPRAP